MRKIFASANPQCENFRISNSNFASAKPNAKISHQPLAIFAAPNVNAKNFALVASRAKPMRNANGHLCELLTARRETKSHSKSLFKGL